MKSDHKTDPSKGQEPLIRAVDVPRLPWLPPTNKSGRRLHYATIHRWILQGVRGVKLRAVRVGGVYCTRESWLMEFFEACARVKTGLSSPTKAANNTQVERDLRDAGLL